MACAGDIGRIAQDQVVALALDGGEQVGLDRPHAVFERVIGDVAAGHGEGVGRDVDRIDRGIGEGVGHQDRQAAGAGAQVEGAAHGFGILDPGLEAAFQQFGEIGARHDDALVHIEADRGRARLPAPDRRWAGGAPRAAAGC
jgi:hypothetical protein